jgi:hypothetical protein
MSSIKDLNRLSREDLAMLWGCSTRTINRAPGIETLRHGTGQGSFYVWDECRTLIPGVQSRLSHPDGLSHGDRLKKIKADDAELDLALKMKTLMLASDVRENRASAYASMRARLLSIPATASVRIDQTHSQAEREAVIRKLIYEALESLASGNLD